MEKVTRLTYLVAMDIGNKPSLLKLDVHPEIKTRGDAIPTLMSAPPHSCRSAVMGSIRAARLAGP